MRAVVLSGSGVVVDDVSEPVLQTPTDAIMRVTKSAICGSDLHIVGGRVPGAAPGMTMGHEAIGTVEAVGDEVTHVQPGDRVLAAFVIPCGDCAPCERRDYGVCEDPAGPGGGVFYGDLGGTQAEFVRIPRAGLGLRRIPSELSDEQALFAGDILATACYANELGGVGPGSTVAVQGCGPVGLLTVQVARARGAARIVAVDVVPERLAAAQRFGAETIDASRVNAGVAVEERLGEGAAVVLDTVGGDPRNLLQALDMVRSGGRVAVVGLYLELEGRLPLAELFANAITLDFGGFCPVLALWDQALELVSTAAVDPVAIISHRMPLEEAPVGYELFARHEAVKVVLDLPG